MSSIETKVRNIASNYGYKAEELYVHIPARGKIDGPHIELIDDFSNLPRDVNRDLMEFVDVSDKQTSTKHKLLNVLVENK